MTAYSHALDFKKLLTLKEFYVITKSSIIYLVKSIFKFTVDGDLDENPRYQKVIKIAIHHFLQHDFDALFLATNAPGRSAFNIVERKMVPLSKELTGLILLHGNYCSHLNERGIIIIINLIIINADLEKKNFEFVGYTSRNLVTVDCG